MATTTAKQWIDSQIEEHTLPSGNVARLKPVDLLDLLALGAIPDTLTGQVDQLLEAGDKTGKTNIPLDRFKEFAQMISITACAAFVEPRLVADEDDEDLEENILFVGRVGTRDKIWVFEWSNGEANNVGPFRPESPRDVGPVPDGNGVSPTPVGDGDDPGSVGSAPVRQRGGVPGSKRRKRTQ